MKTLAPIIILFYSVLAVAQAPNAFNYHGTAIDKKGKPLSGKTITIQVGLKEGLMGNVFYQEMHTTTTDNKGVFSEQVSRGDKQTGNFDAIAYPAMDSRYLNIDIDPKGGFNFQHMGSIELLSVPYALYGEDADSNPQNEIQDITFHKDDFTLSIDNGNTVDLNALVNDNDADPKNELQTLSINSNQISISGGNSITLPMNDDGDKDASNEIQDLQLSEGNILTISNNNNAAKIDLNEVVRRIVMELFTPKIFIEGGFSISELLAYGYTPTELFDAGVGVGTLKQNGIIEQDLIAAGFMGHTRDFEQNVYEWVKIGDQVWMAKNLRSLKYSDGSDIPEVKVYENDESNAEIYGRLYSYSSANRGETNEFYSVFPVNWHLPTQSEYEILTSYLGTDSGGHLKQAGLEHWESSNEGASNSSGFSALPGGLFYMSINSFYYLRMSSYFIVHNRFLGFFILLF